MTHLTLVAMLAADPTPTDVNTIGIVTFLGSKIAPIILAVLGVVFLGRASAGRVSSVLTSSAIAIIGIAFIAGAGTMFFLGPTIIKVLFQ